MAARLSWSLRWRLSVLWALEWGIGGTFFTYLPIQFDDSQLSGQMMAIAAVGLWLAPFVVGQVADRWLSSEKYLAISHFAGGVCLAALATVSDLHTPAQRQGYTLLVLSALFAIAYIPTWALASSLTFRHLSRPDVEFGKVRIWGTVGWMLAGLSLSLWLQRQQAEFWLLDRFPQTAGTLAQLRGTLGWLPIPQSSDCFRMASWLSFALSSFCIFLPRTPPAEAAGRRFAPLALLGMLRNRNFAVFLGVSFLLALIVPLYNLAVPVFLASHMSFHRNWVPAVMLIGQISEFPALLLLPFCLTRLGLKVTFALGMAAWIARYAVFAIGGPDWLVLTGVGLHGICHVFLVIVAQLYIDAQCPRDLRASAQNVLAFVTLGIGMPLGFLLWGRMNAWFGDSYPLLFAAPAGLLSLLLALFWRAFQAPALSPARGAEPG